MGFLVLSDGSLQTTWPNESNKTVKTKPIAEKEQAVRAAVLLVLSERWYKTWIDKIYSVDILIAIAAGIIMKLTTTNKDHLQRLRKAEPDGIDRPEKAYDYLKERKRRKISMWASLGMFLGAFGLTAVFGAAIFRQQSGAVNAIDYLGLGCAVVLILLCVMFIAALTKYLQYPKTLTSEFVGRAWGVVREAYEASGFVDTAVAQIVKIPDFTSWFMAAGTTPDHRMMWRYLEEQFLEHLYTVAVPYVESQSSGKSIPEVDNPAKALFNLMIALVTSIGITEPVKVVRERAYQEGRRRVELKKTASEVPEPEEPITEIIPPAAA